MGDGRFLSCSLMDRGEWVLRMWPLRVTPSKGLRASSLDSQSRCEGPGSHVLLWGELCGADQVPPHYDLSSLNVRQKIHLAYF
jgi:hypothetical protein